MGVGALKQSATGHYHSLPLPWPHIKTAQSLQTSQPSLYQRLSTDPCQGKCEDSSFQDQLRHSLLIYYLVYAVGNLMLRALVYLYCDVIYMYIVYIKYI